MNITKRTLAHLEGVYSTTVVELGGKRFLVGASENPNQESCLFSPPDWKKSTLWREPSGVMNIVQIPGTERLLTITDFYPVFKSEKASIYEIERQGDYAEPWSARKVLSVPFVHRIGIVRGADAHYLLCCALCESKEFQDDWSKPGSLYLSPIGENGDGWKLDKLYHGLTKNHGLYILNHNQVYVGAEEGLFHFDLSGYAPGKKIAPAVVSPRPTGDVYIGDIDGDGALEIGTIEPFHGNQFVLGRIVGGKMVDLYRAGLDFGHVVWIGRIFGAPAAITASRGGDKEIILHRHAAGPLDDGKWERIVVDKGVGATQLSVFSDAAGTHLFAANHGQGEIVLYTLVQ